MEIVQRRAGQAHLAHLAADHRGGRIAPGPLPVLALTRGAVGLVGGGVQQRILRHALEDRLFVPLEPGGQQVDMAVAGMQRPGALLREPVEMIAGEHLRGALPGLPGVVRGPDLGVVHGAEAVVDHHPHVHPLADGQDVAGQDGGDGVAAVVVLDQLDRLLAAHGALPLQAVLELAARVRIEADGGAPPAAADGGVLPGVAEDDQGAAVRGHGRGAEVRRLHPETGGDPRTGDGLQPRDLRAAVVGIGVDALAAPAASLPAAVVPVGGRGGDRSGADDAERAGTHGQRSGAQDGGTGGSGRRSGPRCLPGLGLLLGTRVGVGLGLRGGGRHRSHPLECSVRIRRRILCHSVRVVARITI